MDSTPKAPKPLLKLGPKPKPTTEVPLGPAPAGRPPTNLGKYLIRPTNDTLTGFEMLNDTPDMIEQVQDKYLKLGSFRLVYSRVGSGFRLRWRRTGRRRFQRHEQAPEQVLAPSKMG